MCQSVITISTYKGTDQIKFIKNQAAVGGAICLVSSAGLIYSSTFEDNNAYKYGGAIYFQGCFQKSGSSDYVIAPQVTLIGSGVTFLKNTAGELGGALTISFAASVFFEDTTFNNNKCSFAGGAISSGNCDDLRLFKCKFHHNIVDAVHFKPMFNFTSYLMAVSNTDINKKIPTRFKGRGGGAISFTSDAKKGGLAPVYQKRLLNTRYCCLYQDTATSTGQTFGNGAAHELLLEGYTQWISDGDFVSGFNNEDPAYKEKSQYVSFAGREIDFNVTGYQVYNFRGGTSIAEDICSGISSSSVNIPNESTIEYARTSNMGNDLITGYVPSPSKYTYVATPITRIPKATTKNPSKKTTARTAITDGQGTKDIPTLLTAYTVLPGMKSFTVYSPLPILSLIHI